MVESKDKKYWYKMHLLERVREQRTHLCKQNIEIYLLVN